MVHHHHLQLPLTLTRKPASWIKSKGEAKCVKETKAGIIADSDPEAVESTLNPSNDPPLHFITHRTLPLELWGEIIFHAATSLHDLSVISSVSRDIRTFVWGSPKFKARVLIKNSSNRITHSFFAFFSLPDSAAILSCLIQAKYITPQTCPRAVCLTQPFHNSPHIMRTLLNEGFPPESSTLLVAANRGYLDIFTELIISFVLTAAAAMGHDAIVEVLLARNLIPDPLAGHTATVAKLLSNIHVRTMDKTLLSPALRDAAKGGHVDIVRMLIGLMSWEVVRVLLANGAVPRRGDWMGARRFPEIRQI
ncbi:hypothetical protein BC829DRAFT_399802 [Chytridium lagenaria]|nr:hypothetical protein BC829DRAFT_399802 [Chytridium lagenaria]